MAAAKKLPVRGYLLHLTHYDPRWWKRKPQERPFDLGVALEVVDALAAEGFNLLVIDCADAPKYRSHPELAKRYSVPMKQVSTLAEAARANGLEVVPKLNFSRSGYHHHNDWLLGPGEEWYHHFDDEVYWKKAWEVIDELIAVCKPKRFFHVGMDEDHDRSYTQYAAAIKTLHDGLKKRKLRTLIWNDTGIEYDTGMIHAEKSLTAEKTIPKDIVQVLWRYDAVPTRSIRRIREEGFELWGAPGRGQERVRPFRDAVVKAGGKGLLMTLWIPCRKSNRRMMVDMIHAVGPVYRGDE
ncbi:MAG: hypothetical protein ACE149_17270 [Armatimonadota bacterium]